MSNKVKTVTFWVTLMRKARAEAKAVEDGNPEEIKRTKEDHENYRQLCLDSDEMSLNTLNSKGK